jgi:hypothetical protein
LERRDLFRVVCDRDLFRLYEKNVDPLLDGPSRFRRPCPEA